MSDMLSKIPNSQTNLAGNLFPEPTVDHQTSPTALLKAIEEVLIKIPDAILNLIDKHYSVEVENGDLIEEVPIKRMTVRSPAETISPRMTGDDVIAVLARVANEIQWPLVKDEAAIKLDHSRGVVVLWVDLATALTPSHRCSYLRLSYPRTERTFVRNHRKKLRRSPFTVSLSSRKSSSISRTNLSTTRFLQSL
nr:senescence/dehydration-associated protein [Quercus suber]